MARAQISEVKATLEKERGESLPASNLVLISQGKVRACKATAAVHAYSARLTSHCASYGRCLPTTRTLLPTMSRRQASWWSW